MRLASLHTAAMLEALAWMLLGPIFCLWKNDLLMCCCVCVKGVYAANTCRQQHVPLVLHRFNPWEMAPQVNDPVPGAKAIMLCSEHRQHSPLSRAAVEPHVGPVGSSSLAQLMCCKSWVCVSRCWCPRPVPHCPKASMRKLKSNTTHERMHQILLWAQEPLLHISLSKVCFQHPAFLLRTPPWGVNEVMLFRNRFIHQDNGPLTISQGAVLSCSNQMPGNQCTYFLFIS